MKIHIFADVVCPWCFIGKRRLERALAEFGASDPHNPWTITWQPFQMNPDMPPEGMERGSYLTLKFGSIERARRIENEIAKIGGREGIVFAFDGIDRTPNTLVPHRLLRAAHATGRQGQVIESLFSHYFASGNDIGSIEVLTDIAAEAGMDRAETRSLLANGDNDADKISLEENCARRKGINGVPFFVFEDRYAISGAQPSEVFVRMLELASQNVGAADQPITV